MIRVGIITASDKGSRGEREDRSGQVIAEKIATIKGQVVRYEIVADERDLLAETMRQMADEDSIDLIFTTGGTGFAPRDVTPEATMDVVERLVPGIAEVMRAESLKITPRAMLTRGIAGIRGTALIVNLPGSPKAVAECLDIILSALPHGLAILQGKASECARPE
ncbi:MogA/MoaB family molybdenum cofactor biosynthesis protein [Heliorestis acidaminivorans]|uniref:MogA/MoaB family molybdenum cofactor biosynthesis protein n=1 Tax=Heliorestis acidaminivorans TaxID=553427 RepID=A0A6I0EY08_9FIRM|nr:MogA/MoaB family molybdenum cofactor biosynthesis protein [Heliorestis acidaminivorans]KAB2953291.1 MogA/MoaB family molybdenum cofactor biosynthesis protein [Heliorestis acidaminivorans]